MKNDIKLKNGEGHLYITYKWYPWTWQNVHLKNVFVKPVEELRGDSQ